MTMSGLLNNQNHAGFGLRASVLGDVPLRAESVLSSTAVGQAFGVVGRAMTLGHGRGVVTSSIESRDFFSPVAWKATELSSNLINQGAITGVSVIDTAYQSMIEALERIAEFSSLSDNWDGFGGVGLSDKARHVALQFLMLLLSDELLDASRDLDILPIPTGGIQFEWSEPSGDLEVEIDQDGNFHSLIELVTGEYEESSRDRPLNLLEVRSQIRRILG